MIHRLAPTLKPLTGEAHITDLPGKHWVLAFKWKLSRDINHINKFQVTATSSAFLRNSCRTWQTVQAVETARLPADSVFGHKMGQNKPIHCTDSMQRARQHGALQNITCCTDRSEPFWWNKRDLHNGWFLMWLISVFISAVEIDTLSWLRSLITFAIKSAICAVCKGCWLF